MSTKKNNKYKNMQRILITGNRGFVGTHTQKALEEKGYQVVGYDLKDGYDIRDIDQLRENIKQGDIVLHLAAIARFAEADADPMTAFETNAIGTRNVAQVCSEKKVHKLIYSSTGSVYMPIKEEPPITEDFKVSGNSVYGCSKYIGEQYIETATIPYTILRYAHLYGQGKLKHGAVGGFIDRMERGLAPKLYGGKQSNDFTYIKDVVQANVLAIEVSSLNDVYNIGTGEELTTEEVFNIMKKFFKYDKEFERHEIRTVDPLRFVFDISKAKVYLGYKPEYSFEKGLADYLTKVN